MGIGRVLRKIFWLLLTLVWVGYFSASYLLATNARKEFVGKCSSFTTDGGPTGCTFNTYLGGEFFFLILIAFPILIPLNALAGEALFSVPTVRAWLIRHSPRVASWSDRMIRYCGLLFGAIVAYLLLSLPFLIAEDWF